MNKTASGNPVLVKVIRGALVESRHSGAIAVADAGGRLLLALGDLERPIYPRSAIKAMQALPLIESGAADAFALNEDELAVACASHSGDSVHVEAVRGQLAKAGLDESYLACGAHWPISEDATRELLRTAQRPRAIHNNCSGKHAGMLATAVHLGLDPKGYERPDHQVQIMIAGIISETCGIALDRSRMGIDGCSVPTFPLPLAALAKGFARLGSGEELPSERASAARHPRHDPGRPGWPQPVVPGYGRRGPARGGTRCGSTRSRGSALPMARSSPTSASPRPKRWQGPAREANPVAV
ncbi:MAG TPA: asparaginase, partial [Methyloceanibacter sp.]|nr:asparaginase [Methyloceanibacter sp.]